MRFQAKPFGHATTSPKWRMFLFPINQDQFVDFWSEMSQQGKVWHQDDCQKLEPGCSGKAPWIRLSHIFCWWISGCETRRKFLLVCLKVIFLRGDFYHGKLTIKKILNFSHQTQQIKIPFNRFPQNTDPKEFFFPEILQPRRIWREQSSTQIPAVVTARRCSMYGSKGWPCA